MLPQLPNFLKVRYTLVTLLIIITIFSCMVSISVIGTTTILTEIISVLISVILIALSIISVDDNYKQYMNLLINYVLIKIFDC